MIQTHIHEWQEKIKHEWSRLALREQRMLTIGGIILAIIIIYAGLWAPYLHHIDTLRTQIKTEQKTLAWMQAANDEIQKFDSQSHNKNNAAMSPIVLLSMIQKQTNQAGLTPYLNQLKQVNNESIEMQFQKINFDNLIQLLTAISKEQPITIMQMSVVTANSTPGIVNATVALKNTNAE